LPLLPEEPSELMAICEPLVRETVMPHAASEGLAGTLKNAAPCVPLES